MNFSPLRDYLDPPRSTAFSHYRAYLALQGIGPNAPAHARVKSFLDMKFARTGLKLARVLLRRRCPFQTYDYAAGESGIFALETDSLSTQTPTTSAETRVSLASDWGTGTAEAAAVGQAIVAFQPQFTIHMGDVYYVGDRDEVMERFLGIACESYRYSTAAWPRGSLGSFALNGERQMLANGNGYFQTLLPALGMGSPLDQIKKPQAASFFCLTNEYWMLIAIDTGYRATGYGSTSSACKLEKALLVWLQDHVRPKSFRGAIIIIGHHQYFSAFDRGYDAPAAQLKEILGDRCVLWFWGHEQRFAMYGRYASKNGIPAFGRGISPGGIAVNLRSPNKNAKAPLIAYDNRRYDNIDGTFVGFNGFANLTFSGPRLTVEFFSLSRPLEHGYSLLVREVWESKDGVPQGAGVALFESNLAVVNSDLSAAQR